MMRVVTNESMEAMDEVPLIGLRELERLVRGYLKTKTVQDT